MRITVNGVDTYYEESGSGPALVLVHGLGASTQVWRKVVGPLSEDFRVIRYDLRGLGQSATPEPPYSWADVVRDLDALLEGLELENVTLVGHSLGGALALSYAGDNPPRLGAVIAVGAPGLQVPEGRKRILANAELAEREGMAPVAERHAQAGLPQAFQDLHPDERAAYIAMIAGSDPRGYAAHARLVGDVDVMAALPRIRVPALVVQGELDVVVPMEGVRRAAAEIPDANLVVLEGIGHIVPTEAPEALVEQIRSFLGVEASA
jgi:pimeloyl-ACP methyl ester carboxylesterase